MKVITTLVLALITFSASAQYFNMYSSKEEIQQGKEQVMKNQQELAEKKIRACKSFKKDKKTGEMVPQSVWEYNTKGEDLKAVYYKKGKPYSAATYKYDDKGNLISDVWVYKGDTSQTIKVYDDQNNLTSNSWIKKGKVQSKSTYTFDERSNNTSLAYYGKNNKLWYKYEFEYYPDNSRKTTRSFDHKGRLKAVYEYACGEVGKTPQEMSKDTSRMCIRYETDAEGNRVKIIENFDKKQHGWISITKYNKSNQIVSIENKDPKGKSTYKSVTEYKGELPVAYYQYAKGKLKSSSKIEYDSADNMVKRVRQPGTRKEQVYTYQYEHF